jgi:hypothetical protein
MSHKRKLAGLLVILVAVVATVAVSIASSGASSPSATLVVSALSTPVTSASDIAAREAFARTATEGVDPSTPSGQADLAKAVPAPIAGSSAQAWLAPEGEDICLFIPSPTGNYGSSCFSESAIQQGAGVVVTLKADGDVNGSVTVAEIVPDGQSGPRVTDASGGSSGIAVQSNVAAAVLPASDTVTTGLENMDLSSLIRKPTYHNP